MTLRNVEFKATEIGEQLVQLPLTNPRLYGLIAALGAYCQSRFKKKVIITSLYRKGDKGPHGEWRAVDLRAHHGYWTLAELREIQEWLRLNFPRSDMVELEKAIPQWYGTVRIHGAGDHEHIHVCVERRDYLHRAMGMAT